MIQSIVFNNYNGQSIVINDDNMPAHTLTTTADIRYEEIERAKQDGLWPSWTYLGKRTITCEGDIMASDSATYTQKRLQLLQALWPQSQFGKLAGNLVIDFDGINELLHAECTLDGYPEMPIEAGVVDRSSYQISFKCPNPVFKGEDQSFTFGMDFTTVGRTYNKTFNRTYAPDLSTTSQQIITNNGNFYTFPKVTFYGYLVDPQIILIHPDGTRDYAFLGGFSLASGDSATIDFENKTALTASGLDVYTYTVGSEWWTLQPGANTVLAFADTSDTNAYVVIEWANAYLI